jgi:3-hydroxyisobutyrate dehydrogenase
MNRGAVTEKKIAWIGTGVMGRWMCSHLIQAGYETAVYNRTKSKAEPLIEEGARWCDTPGEAASGADIICSIVGYPADVQEVYFGKQGVFQAARPGQIFIDLTTTKPSLAQRIYARAAELECSAVDAPVSGGDIGAREARLTIMAGGDREVFDYVLPLFEVMGKNIVYQGPAGSGQHTKMGNQIMIAGTMIGMCEALLYGYRAGLDVKVLLETISGGAAGNWSLSNYGPRIIAGNFAPGFYVEHFIKDMGIALEEAAAMELALPGLALVHQFYLALKASGNGKSGTQSLILALDALSGGKTFPGER